MKQVMLSSLFAMAVALPTIASPAEPVMAVEGRTWWYTGFSGNCTGRQTTHEFGLRIGGKVNLDGETWNAIDLCVSADQTSESLDDHWGEYILHDWAIDTTPRTVAYIRETNGRVVTRINHAPAEYQPLERSFNGWRYSNSSGDASDNIIYDFNCDSDTVRLGPIDMPNRYIKTEVDSISSADKVFYIYEFARMDIDRPTSIHPDLFQASPLTGALPTPKLSGNIFCAPFEPCAQDAPPALRYVTDGENNILYEALGGLKAWEPDAFLSTSDLLAPEAATSWHNLQGVEISAPAAPGIYIRRQGTTATKVIIK